MVLAAFVIICDWETGAATFGRNGMSEGNSNRTIQKRDYQTPFLATYGALKDLTQSGSGAKKESRQGAGCRASLVKKPC